MRLFEVYNLVPSFLICKMGKNNTCIVGSVRELNNKIYTIKHKENAQSVVIKITKTRSTHCYRTWDLILFLRDQTSKAPLASSTETCFSNQILPTFEVLHCRALKLIQILVSLFDFSGLESFEMNGG